MKKLLMTFVFSFVLCSLFYAQLPPLKGLQSSNQQLIEEAVKHGLIVIQQTYQLCDTSTIPNKYYGRNNQDYFGKTYSLGIMTTNGFCAFDEAIYPWKYDFNYDKYKDSLKYQPKLYKTYYKGLTDSAFTDMSFNIDDNITLHDNILYNVPFPEFEQGFTFDTKRNGEKKGWLVFVGSKSDVAENDTISLQLTIYRTELEFQEDTFQYEIKKPAVTQTILGGFYINPVFDGVGKIRFDLSGVVRKIKDKWYVVSAVSYQSDNNTIILTPATPVQTDEAEVEDKEDKKGKNNKN